MQCTLCSTRTCVDVCLSVEPLDRVEGVRQLAQQRIWGLLCFAALAFCTLLGTQVQVQVQLHTRELVGEHSNFQSWSLWSEQPVCVRIIPIALRP